MSADAYRTTLSAAWSDIASAGHTQAHRVWQARAGLDAAIESAVWTECLPRGIDLDLLVDWARWLSMGVSHGAS